MTQDRLAFLLQAPELVESVVRATLREALDIRRFHDRAIDVRGFSNQALRELERTLYDNDMQLDAIARHECAAATIRAATCFASSRLGQRLFCMPARRFHAAPGQADAIVSDAGGRLHVVRVETFASDEKRVTCAREIVPVLGAAGLPFHAPSFHFFSLRDGRFRSFAVPYAAYSEKTGAAHRAA